MPPRSRTPQEREVRRVAERYTAAVLQGDAFEASLVVDEALRAGWPTGLVYSGVLAESMMRVGDAWHAGNVSVAHEHRATEITLSEMDRVRRTAQRARANGLRAVVCAVEGERHFLGARMSADLVFLAGWDVDFLGGDVPARDLVRICEERGADVAVLSASVPESIAALREALGALGGARPSPRVIIGGDAASAVAATGEVTGFSAVAQSVDDVPRIARELVASAEPQDLEDLLSSLGQKIQEMRLEQGWSQKQLADAAGLDRTYLSAVEHGRQNVSIAALKKLGDALGVTLSELVAPQD